MEHLNTAVENRAKEEERKREEERRHNEENERRRKEDERRRKEDERRKLEERKQKEERRKSGVRDSREKSPPKPLKNPEIKDDRRRDSKGNGGRRSTDEVGRRSGAHQATINPLLSEVSCPYVLIFFLILITIIDYAVGEETRSRRQRLPTHGRRGGVEERFRVGGAQLTWHN